MEDIMIELKKNVSEKRYIHILGVIDSAVELAEKFSVSKEKARLAAIFHDYAKGMSKKNMLEFSKANKGKVSACKWIDVDSKKLTITILALPGKEDFDQIIDIQKIVEFYSK